MNGIKWDEDKYHAFINLIDQGFFVIDVIFDKTNKPIDLYYVEANDAATKILGMDYTGKRLRDIEPGYEEYWYEIFGNVALTGQSVRMERYAEPDKRWYSFYLFKIGDEKSRRIGNLFIDIAERMRSERIFRFVTELNDALRPLSDAIDIQRTAMRIVGKELAADRVAFGDVMPDGDTVTVHDNYVSGNFPKMTGNFPASAFGRYVVDSLRAGEVLNIPDVDASEVLTDAEKKTFVQLGIRANLTVPLIKDARWISNLSVHHNTPRIWTAEDIMLLNEAAERTWAAVERALAEESLRASEAKYRTLFETMNEGFSVCKVIRDEAGSVVDMVYLAMNPAAERQTGVNRETFIGHRLSEIFTKGDLDNWLPVHCKIYPVKWTVEKCKPRLVDTEKVRVN